MRAPRRWTAAPGGLRVMLSVCVVALATAWPARPAMSEPGVKLAFYNIRSGRGIPGLRGRPVSFADVDNCADASKPRNAWGAGLVQQTLTDAVGSDREVIALGLAEAWTAVCASPENVRAVLGWKGASRSHNGVALVARYGLQGETWLQLDTAQNTNPADTAWLLRADVFVDAARRRTLDVYVAHWYATGPRKAQGYERQAQQTLAFMRERSARAPHVLVGDLNVWTAESRVCRQTPIGATALDALRAAGYVDAWPAIHPAEDGYTGMLNRAKCGTPEGAAWKRIDYAWSPAGYPPLDIARFGVVPAGDAAPSDHYGILARYPLR